MNCGAAGAACTACSTGQSCSTSGECACTADSCDGWCYGSTCELFETIATDQPTFPASRGIATSNSDVYWASSSSSDASADKYRVQRRVSRASVETLLSSQSYYLGPVVLGAERLFVLNPETGLLQSMKTDGSNLDADEPNAQSLRYRSGRIYWHENQWDQNLSETSFYVYSQSETSMSDVKVEYSSFHSGDVQIGDIALASAGRVAYGLNYLNDRGGPDQYEVWVVSNGGTSNVFAARMGALDRLECDASDNYYWLRRTSATGVPDLLMQNDGASSATAVTTNLNVTDFTVLQPVSGMALVYYAYVDPADQSTGIRLYDTSSTKTYDVVTGDAAGSLTTDDTYLYFFEAKGHRLVRTPLPHVVLGLGN
jgi:hypothetical protein